VAGRSTRSLEISMTERAQCRQCGASILQSTADRTSGLCMPCKGGYRDRIEAGKRYWAEERAYRQSPRAKYWTSLVHRVYKTEAGFEGLAAEERTYYALSVLVGEVFNGGFHQFFSNSSGALCATVRESLAEIDAPIALGLLEESRIAIFGDQPFPGSSDVREFATLRALDQPDTLNRLELLNEKFYGDPDRLYEKIEHYAGVHRLYADF
jgi:uncharacterized protein DUF4375